MKIYFLIFFCFSLLTVFAGCDGKDDAAVEEGSEHGQTVDGGGGGAEVGGGGGPQLTINDTDSDGVINEADNCPETYNKDQTDSDSDGIGNACDDDYVGVGGTTSTATTTGTTTNADGGATVAPDAGPAPDPLFAEGQVKFFAGAYNWAGYADGISTAKFLKDNNLQLEEIFKSADPAKTIYDVAMAKPPTERPAKLYSGSALASYNDILYYSGFPGILYRYYNGATQKLAFVSGESGYKDGPGKLAKSGQISDLIVANADIGVKILKGDVIAVDTTNGYLRLIKVSDSGGGVTSMVSNLGPYIAGASRLAVFGNKIYVVSYTWSNTNRMYECGGVYEVDMAGSSPSTKLLIQKENMSETCLPYSVDVLVNNENVYLLGAKKSEATELRFYDRNTGAYKGTYSGAAVSNARCLEWMPDGNIIIAASDEIWNISDPARENVTEAFLAGTEGANVWGQGWQEVDKNWAKNNTKNDYKLKLNSRTSLSLDPDGDTLYVGDVGNNAIRAIHFVKAEDGTIDYAGIDHSELLLGIPFISGAGYKDSANPKEVRFKLPGGLKLAGGGLLVNESGVMRLVKLDGAEHKETLTLLDKQSPKIYINGLARTATDDSGNLYMLQYSSSVGKCQVLRVPAEVFDLEKYPTVEARNNLIEDYICDSDFSGFTLAGPPAIYQAEYLNGYLYMPDTANSVIWRVKTTGPEKKVELFAGTIGKAGYSEYNVEIEAGAALVSSPYAITKIANRLYFYDSTVKSIYEVNLEKDKPTVKLIAGCLTSGQKDGVGNEACFNSVNSIDAYYNNKIMLADMNAETIRMLDVATHEVTTVAGKAYDKDWVDGSFKDTRFNRPLSIACSAALKTCFVGDEQALRVLK